MIRRGPSVACGLLLSLGLLGSAAVEAAGADQRAESGWTLLFDGQDLASWTGQGGKGIGDWMVAAGVAPDPENLKHFVLEPGTGVMVNGKTGRTVNLLTTGEFGDLEVHVEFVVPQGSNSGVYLQGRYEVQILDSWGVEKPGFGDCGGIYERWKDGRGYEGHPPRTNASRRPGQWQSFEIVFRAPRFDADGKKTANARFVKVVHNGVVIHEDVEVTGPTRAATFENNEKPTGPIMLQGDHGPVAYRNLRVRRIALD